MAAGETVFNSASGADMSVLLFRVCRPSENGFARYFKILMRGGQFRVFRRLVLAT